MKKFELLEETELNGQVWYKIFQDGNYIYGTLTRHLEEAESNLEALANGRQATPILKVIKTIEVNETHKTD
jgi:exonuclease VII small subunit